MEENNTTVTSPKQGMQKYVIPAGVLVIIVIVAIGFYLSTNSSSDTNSQSQTQQSASPSAVVSTAVAIVYKDGTYSAKGNYVSPGGSREIDLTVTVKNDVITDVVFKGNATDAPSKRFQGEFGDNFKPMVVGKNIAEVVLTKVSGSSLTPKGFNDALEKIKQEAKAV